MAALTQDILKELLHYDPSTGIFTWRVYRGPNAKMGETAGCIDKDGYRKIKINFRSYWEHRLAFKGRTWKDALQAAIQIASEGNNG